MASKSPTEIRKAIHRQIIQDILDQWPTAKTSGFIKTLGALPDASYIQEMFRHDPDWVAWIRFIPDAYLIDPELRHVVVFEAVNTNDVSDRKFAQMADLSWALDEDYYRLILVRCDRFGRRAYDVQTASLVSQLEHVHAGEKSPGYHVPDWPKYDVLYCEAFFEAAA